MNTLSDFLTPWLADFFLLATLLLTTVMLACWRIDQPARRLAFTRQSFLALFLLAGLCALPGWSLVHLLTPEPTIAEQPMQNDSVDALQINQSVAQPLPATEFENIPQTQPTQETANVVIAPAEISSEQPMPGTAWLAAFYLSGCLFVLLWQASGGVLACRLIRQAIPAPPELQSLLAKITAHAQPAPTLLVSNRIRVPAAIGLRRPIVLLPQHLLEYDPESLLPILAHEWAHIRHGDLRTLAAVRLLAILLWPHPLYLLLRRQVRLDQEALADATASELTTRADYAQQLVELARQSATPRLPRLAASVGLWESASQLRHRVAMLLDDKLTILRTCSRRWRIGSAIGLLTIAAGLSMVTLTPPEPLQAEDAPQTVEKPADIKTTFRPAVPVADSDDNTSVADSESSTAPVITDEEKGKLMRSHFKRLYDKRKPNNFIGLCIDEVGNPIEGVLVEVFVSRIRNTEQDDKPILSTRSNAKGEYRFENVIDIEKVFPDGLPEENFNINPKVLTIIGRFKGRVPGFDRDLATGLVRHGKASVWVMQRAHTLRGRVTDEQGQPVAGAVVKAGVYGSLGGSHGINAATTDEKGKYEIADLAALDAVELRREEAEYLKANPESTDTRSSYADSRSTVLIKHPKFASKRASIENIPGKVDVQLVSGSTIEGIVKLPEGAGDAKSIAGSIVHLQRAMPPPKVDKLQATTYMSLQIEKTTVNETGHYRFDSLPAGKYRLTTNVEGWVTPGIENVEVEKGATVNAPDILLTQGGRVRVQLVDDKTGRPMTFEKPTKGFIIPVARPRHAMPSLRRNIVEFSTEGIAEKQVLPGRYGIFASIPQKKGGDLTSMPTGQINDWPTQEVAEGELVEVTARMRKREPQLADGILTTTSVAQISSPSDEAEDDEIEDDSGDDKSSEPEATASEELGKEKNSKQEFKAVQWPETIQGVVLDEESGPIANAKVRLQLKKIHNFSMGRWDEQVAVVEGISDESGLFTLDVSKFPELKHRPLSLMLTGSAPGYANTRTWIWYSEPKPDVESWSPQLKMLSSRTIRGRCLDPNGKPVSKATLKILADHGKQRLWSTQPINHDGTFKIDGPQGKDVEYWICTEQWSPKWGKVEPSQTELGNIQLEKGTALEGRVLDRDGNPIADTVVVMESAFDGEFDHTTFSIDLATKTDAQGHYRLPPGLGAYKVYLTQAIETENRPEGTFLVSKNAPPPIVPHFIQLDGKQPTQHLDIKAGPTLKLSGVVQWKDGRKVSGFEVMVSYMLRGINYGTGIWIAKTHTNERGEYQLEVANPIGEISIHAFGKYDEDGVYNRAYPSEMVETDQESSDTIQFGKELTEDRDGLNWVLLPDED